MPPPLLVVPLLLLAIEGGSAASRPLGWLSRLSEVHVPVGRPSTANCTTHWREVPLDHFNYAETRTLRQRYFVYDAHWKPDGPVLFYCGNEANVELYVNATGLMWERAAELGALLVWAEHRYYGESLPFGAASASNGSTLQWLTLEQALADYATLIYDLRRDLGAPAAPVVALGGSYGGMLAAWLRMHYPAAVAGALAASAPVLAFDGLLRPSFRTGGATPLDSRRFDGNSFWRVVTADASPAAGAEPGCVPGVRGGFAALFAHAGSEAGRQVKPRRARPP